MAIVQISKIIHRTGANVDLPQLAAGEIGFASDERKVYIGNDDTQYPVLVGQLTTQTEIITDNSYIRFSQVNSATNLESATDINQVVYSKDVEHGQIISANVDTITGVTTWYNAGGTTGGTINLGDVSNVKLLGAPGTTYVIKPTDTNGNLDWAVNNIIENGTSNVKISASGSNVSISVDGTSNAMIVTATGYKTVPVIFSQLPLPATAGAGSRAFITDANNNSFGSQVSGLGANSVPVYCDGSNWFVG